MMTLHFLMHKKVFNKLIKNMTLRHGWYIDLVVLSKIREATGDNATQLTQHLHEMKLIKTPDEWHTIMWNDMPMIAWGPRTVKIDGDATKLVTVYKR